MLRVPVLFLLLFCVRCHAQDDSLRCSYTSVYDSTLNRSYYTYVDEMPSYAGGEDSLRNVLAKNMRWPHTHGCASGMVVISMIIEADGSVSNVFVKKGFHPLYDQEALRVAKLLTAWTPGKCNGVAVAVQRYVPIKFVTH